VRLHQRVNQPSWRHLPYSKQSFPEDIRLELSPQLVQWRHCAPALPQVISFVQIRLGGEDAADSVLSLD
jgi:hypothetical protein